MPVVLIALVTDAVAPPEKSSSATNGAAAGPPAEISTPAAAANALGAARLATSVASTRAAAARTAVAARRDRQACLPGARDPGGRPSEIRMFIGPPMCQLCSGSLNTRLISQRNVTLPQPPVKHRDDGLLAAFRQARRQGS